MNRPARSNADNLDASVRLARLRSRMFAQVEVPRIAQYQLRHKIGGGGMGLVFAAWDPSLDRQVAIKVLRDAWSEGAGEQLRREAVALARLRHRALDPLDHRPTHTKPSRRRERRSNRSPAIATTASTDSSKPTGASTTVKRGARVARISTPAYCGWPRPTTSRPCAGTRSAIATTASATFSNCATSSGRRTAHQPGRGDTPTPITATASARPRLATPQPRTSIPTMRSVG